MKLKTLALAAVVGMACASSQAAVVFQDNFDADNPSSALNFNSLINWTVAGGTVDYIRSGGFGITCAGGTGACLDLDGSTGNAGRIVSRTAFSLIGGDSYLIEGLVSGNQRGGSSDSVIVGLIDDATNTVATSATFSGILPGRPFQITQLMVTATSGNFRVFWEGVGADNVGVILDNVTFSDATTRVPEPGTLALAGLGLLAAVSLRKRRAR
jgi:hypothetical protein